MKKIILASTLSALSFGAMSATLPTDLNWQTNWDEPQYGSPEAKRGGTYRTFMSSFPQTLRSVGPDANSGLRSFILDETPGLVVRHPDTLEFIPELANEWALAGDNKTVYFKLNPQAKWSDGKPVTADDFVFMLKFYRSKDILEPWYNDYYNKTVADVIKFDDHTFAVKAAKELNPEELLLRMGALRPRPAHFYANPKKDENGDGIHDDFVRYYNFKSEPTTSAYYLADVKKGKSVTFKHVGEDWWGYTNKYYENRYNVDKIRITVIRDSDIAMKHFEKGKLDAFGLVLPSLWHDKSNTAPYQKGYIEKFWGYNQYPVGAGGVWINTTMPLLDDLNIRKGITYATDFDGMIENVMRRDYSRKPNPTGFGHGKYTLPDVKAPKFEPEKAAAAFEAAGFDKIGSDGIRVNDKGQRLSFELTYSSPVHTPRIAFLREQAKLAGLDIELKLIDGSSMFKYVREKKHELAFFDMGTSEIPTYWEYFHSVNANKPQTNSFTNYSTPELDEKIIAYRFNMDMDKKIQLGHEIQRDIIDAHVIVTGYMVPYVRYGHWRWLKLPEKPMNRMTEALFSGGIIGDGTYWIDKDVKKETQKAMKSGKTFEPVVVVDDTYKL
ncbi:ABC transporter substrate-binding protein [Vibrio parahaemolyticus]|nr:ABC transporter substrate-binding protein [Vibrio parahaemolyticus]